MKTIQAWNSLTSLCMNEKLATRFCMAPKVRSAGQTKEYTPVYLNVYDLTPMNGYVYWAGLGIFHSGVEVHGVEYAFGAHNCSMSGVFEVEPRHCPGFRFRKSILIGTTSLDPTEVREFMEQHSVNYLGDTYHLIVKNCNHFCQDVCYKLTGNSIPKWVNRLAKIGSRCKCLLPQALRVADKADYKIGDCEKTRLRSTICGLSSLSVRQKQVSASSLFLPSPSQSCNNLLKSRSSSALPLKQR